MWRLQARPRRDHLIVRWNPSATAVTQATPTATRARLYRAEVEGTPIAYREAGPATGIPVVFLHHHDLFAAQALDFLRD